MKFTIFDVGDKGLYLRTRLEEEGHEAVDFDEADVLLLDCDWAWAVPRPQLISKAVEQNTKVVLYPHGGQPTVFVYDGLTRPHPSVDIRLEHGPRSADLAGQFGVPNVQAYGWLYSPTRPFEPVKDAKRVLFAPLHPNIEALQKGGPDIAPKLNQRAYRELLGLGFDVTVSAVGPLWRNGIWRHPRAEIVANPLMRLSASLPLVADADVVVAAGTLAAVAVALGKPTVFLDAHDCSDYLDGRYRQADHAADYQDLMRYPLVAGDGALEDLIQVACKGSDATRMWRDWWIGNDGTGAAIRALEQTVGQQNASRRDVIIGGVTARAAGAA